MMREIEWIVTLSPAEVARGALAVGYQSGEKGRAYLIPLGLQPIKMANQSADSTTSAGTSAAEQPRVPASAARHL